MVMKRERDIAIDIVKFLAVLLIINSHADCMYPKYQILATGGQLATACFCSVLGLPCSGGGRNRLIVTINEG